MTTPSSEEPDGLFEIEEIDGSSMSPDKECSQSPEVEVARGQEASSSTAGINEDIELSRRAVPVVEVEEDVCSICLDEFTAEDPEQNTICEYVLNLDGLGVKSLNAAFLAGSILGSSMPVAMSFGHEPVLGWNLPFVR